MNERIVIRTATYSKMTLFQNQFKNRLERVPHLHFSKDDPAFSFDLLFPESTIHDDIRQNVDGCNRIQSLLHTHTRIRYKLSDQCKTVRKFPTRNSFGRLGKVAGLEMAFLSRNFHLIHFSHSKMFPKSFV